MNRPLRPYSQITLDERRKIERWNAAKIYRHLGTAAF